MLKHPENGSLDMECGEESPLSRCLCSHLPDWSPRKQGSLTALHSARGSKWLPGSPHQDHTGPMPPPVRSIAANSPHCPFTLQVAFGQIGADRARVMGPTDLLSEPSIGLVCSQRCPGRIVNATYDLIQRLRDARRTVIGGFHSPMEQECLRLLLRGSQPVVICPARSIDEMRIPPDWRQGLEAGRLLLVSPFPPSEKRVTVELAARRNRFVAALATEVLIPYAGPDSATERLAQELARKPKPLLTIPDPENERMLQLGARPTDPADYPARADQGTLPLFD